MANGEPVLIAAYSGRALAASARRGGYAPLVADFFGDEDTLAVAEAHVRLRASLGDGIDGDELETALSRLAVGARPIFVGGAGFEDRAATLARVGRHWPLMGNSPDVVARVKDPDAVAVLCRRHHVPHPDICHEQPGDTADWLVKRIGGAGGSHIRRANGQEASAGTYFQRRVGGEAVSALVLADGERAMVLGFSTQWTSPTEREPFRYGGAAQPAAVAPALAQAMHAAAARLTADVGLVGLNSFDFLVDGDEFHLLEINPRPGATLDIFEPPDGSLFALHVAACRGSLPQTPPAYDAAHASTTVYAAASIAALPAFDWPDWAADRSPAGTPFSVDAPFCTVSASAPTVAEARRLVAERAERIFADVQARLS